MTFFGKQFGQNFFVEIFLIQNFRNGNFFVDIEFGGFLRALACML